MKKIVSLTLALVLCLSLCACGGKTPVVSEPEETEASTTSTNLWSVQKMVDEFGDVIEGSMSVIQTPIYGDFSNTATSSSELTGYVFMYMMDGYPTFSIRLFEYGDHQATYTSNDTLALKIKIRNTISEFHPVLENPPNGDLMVYDSTETLYTALYNGTDAHCIVEIGNSKYNFTLYSDNFADICNETGYITQTLYFSKTDNEVLYNEAKNFIAEGNYSEAIEFLEYLDDYADSKELLLEVLYNEAKNFKAEGNYSEAIEFLEYLDDYADSKELLLEIACDAYYYYKPSDSSLDIKNTWKQFFDKETAVPLTDEEIKEIIIGDWRTADGDTYSTYTETGGFIYTQGGVANEKANKWFVENGRLVIDYEYFTSECTIYPFYKNVYVFCTHQSSSNVYELHFHNGPLE